MSKRATVESIFDAAHPDEEVAVVEEDGQGGYRVLGHRQVSEAGGARIVILREEQPTDAPAQAAAAALSRPVEADPPAVPGDPPTSETPPRGRQT